MARAQIGVPLLDNAVLRPPVSLGDRIGFRYAPYLQVAGSDGPNFAGADQAVERFHALFQGCLRVVAVGIIQVECIGSKPAQGLIALTLDFSRAEPTLATGIVKA